MYLSCICALSQHLRVSGFVSLFVLIGNSTLVGLHQYSYMYKATDLILTKKIPSSFQPSTRGSVNGISQSLVAVGRSVGPLLGSTLLSWSESNGKC